MTTQSETSRPMFPWAADGQRFYANTVQSSIYPGQYAILDRQTGEVVGYRSTPEAARDAAEVYSTEPAANDPHVLHRTPAGHVPTAHLR